MKRGFVVLGILLFGAAVYFIAFQDTEGKPQSQTRVSPENPFFAPKAVEFPFDTDRLEYGEKLLQEDKVRDAIAVFGLVASNDASEEKKAAAMLSAGMAFTTQNDTDSPRFAKEVFEQYLLRFPKNAHADTAHYYLGAIAADDRDLSEALAQFTTITADFPESGFARNAAFHSKKLAASIEQKDSVFKSRILRVVGPLFPRNPAAMTTLLAYVASILGWLTYDWKKVKHALIEEKHPAAWTVLVLSIALVGFNYVREWRFSATALDMPKILQPLKR